MKKAVIFGSNGQDGQYLIKLLKTKNIRPISVSRKSPAEVIGNVSNLGLVEKLIKNEKPDYIFHLAANSTTRHEALWDNHEAISTGSMNILESAYKYSQNTSIFLSGSGLQFENINKPIKESDPLVASSPYVIARNYSLYAARYYRNLGLKVYFGFFFNHDSPLRTNRHMAAKIANYCKSIKSSENEIEPLSIGDLSVKKEWTFAGDIVNGMWRFINQEEIYEMNISSGLDYSIQEWVEVCFRLSGKDWRDYIISPKGFKAEYNTLVSDASKLKSLGWSPEVSFEELAKMMVLS